MLNLSLFPGTTATGRRLWQSAEGSFSAVADQQGVQCELWWWFWWWYWRWSWWWSWWAARCAWWWWYWRWSWWPALCSWWSWFMTCKVYMVVMVLALHMTLCLFSPTRTNPAIRSRWRQSHQSTRHQPTEPTAPKWTGASIIKTRKRGWRMPGWKNVKSATKCNEGGEAGREEGLKRQKITRFFPCASLVTQWCHLSKCRTVNWLLLWILWNHCLSPNLWSFCVVTRPDQPTWKHSSVQIMWLNKHGFLFQSQCSLLSVSGHDFLQIRGSFETSNIRICQQVRALWILCWTDTGEVDRGVQARLTQGNCTCTSKSTRVRPSSDELDNCSIAMEIEERIHTSEML